MLSRSRAMRVRRVSRRGRRSTVSSRAGSNVHDRAAHLRRHFDPGGDLVARASAAEAVAGLHVHRADEDAGRFDSRHDGSGFVTSTWDKALANASRRAHCAMRRIAAMPPAISGSAGISHDERASLRRFPRPCSQIFRRATRRRQTACGRCLPKPKSLPARSAAWKTSRRGWRNGPDARRPRSTGRWSRSLPAITAWRGAAISPRPVEATARAVELCAAGGAAINQVCLAYDLGLKVFDLALHLPTGDITLDAALDERGCAATMAYGMEAIAGGTDLLCLGDLGVGNSTVAAAIFCMLYGGKGADWVGPGSGADEAMMRRKAEAVDAAVALHGSHAKDPLEVLRRVGGREFAAIAGAIIAARAEKVPVILDGFGATAAACVLHAMNPAALDHCLLAQIPTEPGHARAAKNLGLEPLLDLKLAHGEGVGAALAAGLVKAAALHQFRHGAAARSSGQLANPSSARLAAGRTLRVGRAGSSSMTRAGREDGDGLGALAQLRAQLELAVMHGEQPLDDRQPEAGALFGALDGDRALAEGRQHDRDFVGRDAGAVVLDRNVLAAAGGPADAHQNLAAGRW